MYLLGNGRLVIRDDANPYLENGCVAVEGNLIKEVCETAALKAKYPEAEFIDAKGGVIMPGFINAHNHIYSAFACGLTIKGNLQFEDAIPMLSQDPNVRNKNFKEVALAIPLRWRSTRPSAAWAARTSPARPAARLALTFPASSPRWRKRILRAPIRC